MDILQINKLDNVAVALKDLQKGTVVSVNNSAIELPEDIPSGHKVAIRILPKMKTSLNTAFPSVTLFAR